MSGVLASVLVDDWSERLACVLVGVLLTLAIQYRVAVAEGREGWGSDAQGYERQPVTLLRESDRGDR